MSRHTFLALRDAFAILPCVIASTPTLSSRHLKPARCSSMIDMPTPLSSADLAVAYLHAAAQPAPDRDAAGRVFRPEVPKKPSFSAFIVFCTIS